MATKQQDLKQRVVEMIDALPADALQEVATFVEYQRYKIERGQDEPPYKPIALGGLWKGIQISEQDIEEARREMWGRFGEREF